MADYPILKAVEFDALPAKFKKARPTGLRSFEAEGYWLQRKYDGCFGLVDTTACTVKSRTGTPIKSCDHILRELRDALGPGYVVIGEVWEDGAAFPKISGDFRRGAPSPHLQFVVNDLLTVDEYNSGESLRSYNERWNALCVLVFLGRAADSTIIRAQTFFAGMWTDAMGCAIRWQAEGGYDGAIIRNPEGTWYVGLVKNGEIIKVKPRLSLDLLVTGWKIETGVKTGREVLTICVKYNGVDTWVGSGIPHQRADQPKVGDIVEVECLGITDDGRLREPVFKGVRHDKLKPD